MGYQIEKMNSTIEMQNGKFKAFDNIGTLNDRSMGQAEKLKNIESHLGEIDEKVS